jgi:hypothetical protein
MSRAQLTSTVEQNTGGAVAPFVAGKNVVINGNYDIWQRGTTFASAGAGVYTADRFTSTLNGTGINLTVTQDTSVPNLNSIYSMKYTQTSAATSIVEYATRYWAETQDAIRFAGKTVTLSFWYKSNKTGTHGARLGIAVQAGGADASVGFNVVAANTWQYITWTTAAPFGSITAINTAPNAGIGFIDIGFRVGGAGPVGFTSIASGDYFQISQLQLELGSVATPFSRAGGTLQGELAACQRYFYSIGTASGIESICNGTYYSSTAFYGVISYPVPMRTAAPSVTVGTAGSFTVLSNGASRAVTSVSTQWTGQNAYTLNFNTSAATAGNGGWVQNSATSGYLQFSAEL